MEIQDGAAYFIVSKRYNEQVLTGGSTPVGTIGLRFNTFLSTQSWATPDQFQIVVAQQQDDSLFRFLFQKEESYLSLDNSENHVIVEMRGTSPPRVQSSWMVDLQYYDDDDSPVVSLQNNDSGDYLVASHHNKVALGGPERTGDAYFWKLIRLPTLHAIQTLRKTKKDYQKLRAGRSEANSEIGELIAQNGELKAYIQSISSRLTQMLGYLQAGQYQTMWPWYTDLEVAVRNFIQRGYHKE